MRNQNIYSMFTTISKLFMKLFTHLWSKIQVEKSEERNAPPRIAPSLINVA